jgi:hypothetical protein
VLRGDPRRQPSTPGGEGFITTTEDFLNNSYIEDFIRANKIQVM